MTAGDDEGPLGAVGRSQGAEDQGPGETAADAHQADEAGVAADAVDVEQAGRWWYSSSIMMRASPTPWTSRQLKEMPTLRDGHQNMAQARGEQGEAQQMARGRGGRAEERP